jgi:hypothetical protein
MRVNKKADLIHDKIFHPKSAYQKYNKTDALDQARE